MPVDDALLERNDGVVGDGDVLGTDLGAALGDVAVADAVAVLELVTPIEDVERMHLELRGMDQQAGADELFVQLVVAEHVTDVLTEEALYALSKFLHAVGVVLHHAPGAVG